MESRSCVRFCVVAASSRVQGPGIGGRLPDNMTQLVNPDLVELADVPPPRELKPCPKLECWRHELRPGRQAEDFQKPYPISLVVNPGSKSSVCAGVYPNRAPRFKRGAGGAAQTVARALGARDRGRSPARFLDLQFILAHTEPTSTVYAMTAYAPGRLPCAITA